MSINCCVIAGKDTLSNFDSCLHAVIIYLNICLHNIIRMSFFITNWFYDPQNYTQNCVLYKSFKILTNPNLSILFNAPVCPTVNI